MEAQNVTPPTKVCPHCGTQAQTTGKKCPSCGKGYKKRTGLKIFAGLCLLGLVAIVGCAALIGSAANDVQNEADKHAITKAQFDAVEQGTSQSAVEKQLGTPEDSQEFENKFGKAEPQGSSCIYYNEKGKDLFEGSSFQFCFTERKLDSKNAY
jgi:hypothetical protein